MRLRYSFSVALTFFYLLASGCSAPDETPAAAPDETTAVPEKITSPGGVTMRPGPAPNIIVILLHDAGFADLGAYGSEISTPHIDRLAANGVQFTNFHVAAACTPTRGMLLTGVDNHLVGMGNMIEIMADNQFDQPGYEGFMGYAVVTLPTLLRDAGYHTYMAGKWHLGKTKKSIPAARGFERSISLMESGADNWEKKSYLPLYENVHFYEDFDEVDLPDDFFSTNYYVDRLKEYIGKDHGDGKPFFAYLSPTRAVSNVKSPSVSVFIR